MGFFNFIETFFFLSLGITFVLILLLVYHFKQRVTTLEQKCDTMFDILNTMVKELNALRNAQLLLQQFPFSRMPSGESAALFSQEPSKIPVSDSETSSELGELSSEEDEYENIEEEEDDDVESDVDEEETLPPLVDIIESTGPVKIINVNMGDVAELEEHVFDNVSDTEIENSLEDNLESTQELQIENSLRVEKMSSPEPLPEQVNTLENNESSVVPKDIYRRMPLQNLKALVISKGLSSDPSKMKKIDLVRMLEEADE
jgi:hypothetical protein